MSLFDAAESARLRVQATYDQERELAIAWMLSMTFEKNQHISELVMLDADDPKAESLSEPDRQTLLTLAWLGYNDLLCQVAERDVTTDQNGE